MSRVVYQLFEIQAPAKIPSVNNMYKPKSIRGKSFAWLYKDDKVQNYQDLLIRSAKGSPLADMPFVEDDVKYIDVSYIFLLDQNFLKRDVSNMIKMTEDALMAVTKIDDSKHRKVSAVKVLSLIPKTEFVICKYEVHLNEDK